ncbi:hypothetical protein BKA66DRAFT_292319 [Pyrenochaeta sp. MPI-SDFR-AT-0127]|nr:hypothetical protein BKA66DRAFT_292319 [Pyrenochaeta sp. MPI-SDFR-AT-0127]
MQRIDRSQCSSEGAHAHTAYVAARNFRYPKAEPLSAPVRACDSRSVETAGRSKVQLLARYSALTSRSSSGFKVAQPQQVTSMHTASQPLQNLKLFTCEAIGVVRASAHQHPNLLDKVRIASLLAVAAPVQAAEHQH